MVSAVWLSNHSWYSWHFTAVLGIWGEFPSIEFLGQLKDLTYITGIGFFNCSQTSASRNWGGNGSWIHGVPGCDAVFDDLPSYKPSFGSGIFPLDTFDDTRGYQKNIPISFEFFRWLKPLFSRLLSQQESHRTHWIAWNELGLFLFLPMAWFFIRKLSLQGGGANLSYKLVYNPP